MNGARRHSAIQAGHKHREAFNLMWYACKNCGHRERYWNSRDGVTPFGTECPSCGRPDLIHDAWHLDQYAPDHKPHHGQRLWVAMTLKAAEAIAKRRIAAVGRVLSEAEVEQVVNNFYEDGRAPNLRIHGYQDEEVQE